MGTWLARTLIGLTVALASMGVDASELSRCIGRGGAISYVSGACPTGSRTDWHQELVPAKPMVMDAYARARMADAREWQARNRAEVSSLVRSQNARGRGRGSRTVDRCAQAKKRRDRTRDREFRSMTYDRAVSLDDQVREACR